MAVWLSVQLSQNRASVASTLLSRCCFLPYNTLYVCAYTHTYIRTYIDSYIYENIYLCVWVSVSDFLQLKFGKSFYWNINKMKYAKSAGKLMQNIGAFEVLNFLRAKKLVWFDFSSLFVIRLFSNCVRKTKGQTILWCAATSNSNLETRVEFYFLQVLLVCFSVGHARNSMCRPLALASQWGSWRSGVGSFAPHPKFPFLSLHFLLIRLLQLVCAVALPAEHPHAHTQTAHTRSSGSSSRHTTTHTHRHFHWGLR